MKFDKLVQTVLNEYNESPDVVQYYKWEPHTNEYGRPVEFKFKALYDYDDPPSKEEGWFRTKAEAEKFAEEKGKKQ